MKMNDDFELIIHGSGSGISGDESIDDYEPVVEGGGDGISTEEG